MGSDGDEHPATLNVERHASATAAAPARTRMWSPLYRRFKPPSLYLPLVRFSDMSHRVFTLPASLARRATAPVLASTVVGVVLGVVGVLGIAAVSGQSTVPEGSAVSADEAVLGGPEYGSRK